MILLSKVNPSGEFTVFMSEIFQNPPEKNTKNENVPAGIYQN